MYIFPYGRTGTYGHTDGQTNQLTEAPTRSLKGGGVEESAQVSLT